MKTLKIFLTFVLISLFFSHNGFGQIAILQARSAPQIGDMAPDLTFFSPDGIQIKLSSLRGKMVLIDFWASWCKPCRFENPNVIEAYNKFKDKQFNNANGFTVYSVSLDQTKEDWEKAILTDGLLWENHVSDLKGWDSDAAQIYKVNAIPCSFLIDGDGRLVETGGPKGKDLRGDNLEKTIKKYLKKD